MRRIFDVIERDLVPDWLLRLGVRQVVRKGIRERRRMGVEAQTEQIRALIEKFKQSPIAVHTADANRQHYELPTEFFQTILGPWLKYSCCHWPDGVENLEAAEEAMLHLTCERAQVEDGMRVLDLGCGWGSLSLWIATHYPACEVLSVSNSHTQIEHIREQCRQRGLSNVTARVADVNTFAPQERFDRTLSIEMFEHMKNYQRLLARIASILTPDGKLFVHIFSNRHLAYEFDASDPNDWMARTFFAGGTMPSDDLLLHFQRDLYLVDHWRLNGIHYAKTLRAWLDRMDRHERTIRPILARTYGPEQETRWWVNWRLFFLSCEETFGICGGNEFLVSHYLFGRR